MTDVISGYFDAGAEFGVFSGTDAASWWISNGYTDTAPEITDKGYNPKREYYAVVDTLKSKL
jgi:hypothetical protein